MNFFCFLFDFSVRKIAIISRYYNLLGLSFLLAVFGLAWSLPANFLSAQSYQKLSDKEILLSHGEWVYSTKDLSRFSLSESNTTQWNQFDLNRKVYTAQGPLLWMQTKFSLNPSAFPWLKEKGLILFIEGICGEETIFLNQTKLRPVKENLDEKKAALRCFRPALYYVLSSNLFLDSRENTLSIRTAHRSNLHTASVQGKISILPIQDAYIDLRNKSLKGVLYSIFSLGIGILFFFLYRRAKFKQEYFLFSIFSFLYSLYQITQNDLLYLIWDNTLLYIIIHQIAFFMLPTAFFLFYIHFYSIQNIPIISTKNSPWKIGKAVRISVLGSLLISLLSVFFLSSGLGLKLQSLWLLIHTPFLLYFLYLSFPKLKIHLHETLFILLGMAFLCLSFFSRLWKEPLGTPFLSHEGLTFLAFQISLSVALVLKVNPKRSERKSPEKNSETIFHIAEKFFLRISQISSQQIHKIICSISQIMREKNLTKRQKEAVSLLYLLQNLARELQNALLLARIETRPNSEKKEKIQIETLLSPYFEQMGLLCHIRIEKKSLIYICSELFHLFMDSLLSFLKKNLFLHTDLVVIADSGKSLIFRFIAFHKDSIFVGRLYRNLIYTGSREDFKQNEWKMIQEISRTLQGKLTVNNKSSSFLTINLELESLDTLENKNQEKGLQLLMNENTSPVHPFENRKNSSSTIPESEEKEVSPVKQKKEKIQSWVDMNITELLKMIYKKTRSISLGWKKNSS